MEKGVSQSKSIAVTVCVVYEQTNWNCGRPLKLRRWSLKSLVGQLIMLIISRRTGYLSSADPQSLVVAKVLVICIVVVAAWSPAS